MAYRDERLKCEILKLDYDFSIGLGTAYFPENNCCDMEAIIKIFENISKNVATIITYSGRKEDAVYRKTANKWHIC